MAHGSLDVQSYARLLDSLDVGVLVERDDGRAALVNARFCALAGCGVKAAELVGLTRDEVIAQVGQKFVEPELFAASLGTPTGADDHGPELTMTDGRVVEIRVAELVDASGVSLVTQIRDVTARARAERALRDSEVRYRSVFESGALAITIIDPHTRLFIDVNERMCEFLGYSREQMLAKSIEDVTHPEDVEIDAQLSRRVFDGEIPFFHIDKRFVRRNGEVVWGHLTATFVRDDDGVPIYGIGLVEDITRQKATEETLRQHQKLEALGTLASGVAHEVNNPIQGILSYAQLLRHRLGSDLDARHITSEIIRECERIASIVRNLLTFARQEPAEHEPWSVPELIEGTLSLVRALLRSDHIELHVDVADELPRVVCHGTQVQQVIMNLVTNARDALNDKYPEHHRDKRVEVLAHVVKENGHECVRITVADRGAGIHPEVAERIFDPFFTTKSPDKGTGLGLSLSHGIIAEHHGELVLDIETEGVTKFHIHLPIG